MTDEEKNDFALQVASEVMAQLLLVINASGMGNDWVYNTTDDYMDSHDQHQEELQEEYAKSKYNKSQGKKKPKTEAELVGEVASLMTQVGMHVQKEEYEKCAAIQIKIEDIKKTLRDVYNIDLDCSEDE